MSAVLALHVSTGLEDAVKRLVHKHCGHDPVPADLRQKVLLRIEAVRAQLETG